jgi:hypothetical protein
MSVNMQHQTELENIRAQLLQNVDPERAKSEKAYLKSEYFYSAS